MPLHSDVVCIPIDGTFDCFLTMAEALDAHNEHVISTHLINDVLLQHYGANGDSSTASMNKVPPSIASSSCSTTDGTEHHVQETSVAAGASAPTPFVTTSDCMPDPVVSPSSRPASWHRPAIDTDLEDIPSTENVSVIVNIGELTIVLDQAGVVSRYPIVVMNYCPDLLIISLACYLLKRCVLSTISVFFSPVSEDSLCLFIFL